MDIPSIPLAAAPSAGFLRLNNLANRLEVIDPDGVHKKVAYSSDNETFSGEPTNYVAEVAATAMTATYTADTAKTILLTSLILGVLDPAPSLDIVDPAAPNATLAVAEDLETRVVTVTPATGDGDAAVALIPTGVSDQITVTLTAAGPDGNDLSISCGPSTKSDPLGESAFPDPEFSAPTCALFASTYSVLLANTAGTAGVLTLTESTASAGEITITQTAPWVGVWGNDHVNVEVILGGASTVFGVVATSTATDLNIAITLETTSEGVAVAISDDNLATAVAAALAIVNGTDDFSGYFDVASSTLGNFDSPATATMAGGVDAVYDDTANTATALALAIAGAEGVASAVASTGADIIADLFDTLSFTGGGDNAAITSDLDDLAAILLADSTLINGVVGTGDGATLITDSTTTLTGGTDVVPAVPGTPGKLGRLATDGTDVWTALVDDNTTTQAGWVKTFTA